MYIYIYISIYIYIYIYIYTRSSCILETHRKSWNSNSVMESHGKVMKYNISHGKVMKFNRKVMEFK